MAVFCNIEGGETGVEGERGGRSRRVSPSPTDMQIAIGTY